MSQVWIMRAVSESVPPGLAPLPAAWSSFFIAIAEVAATLAGLSFVAVSAHPSILRTVHTRYKAQRTLLTFVVVLGGALILAMPQQPAALTTTVLLWSSVAGAALTLVSIVRESRSGHPRDWLRIARSLNSVEFLLAYTVAGGWALLHLAPADQPLNPHVLGSAMIVALGWSAVQTWRLMQLAVHARWHDEHPDASHRLEVRQPTTQGGPPAAPVPVPRDGPEVSAPQRAEQHRDGPS
jgi:hypothetical protein